MLSNLDLLLFTSEAVAGAVGIPFQTLSAQIQRRSIVFPPGSILNAGQGRTRYFSLRGVLHAALTHELSRTGVSVGHASDLAGLFTMQPEDEDAAAEKPSRRACGLYGDDTTVFRVLHIPGQKPTGSIDRFTDVNHVLHASTTLIDLNHLVARTTAALGVGR